jgi:GDPmannose 4,6-dehydratase
LDAERYVVSDPEFFRPVDADILVGDATKARSRLGWEPTVSFSGLVAMMVDGDLLEARAGDSGLTGGSSIIPP